MAITATSLTLGAALKIASAAKIPGKSDILLAKFALMNFIQLLLSVPKPVCCSTERSAGFINAGMMPFSTRPIQTLNLFYTMRREKS